VVRAAQKNHSSTVGFPPSALDRFVSKQLSFLTSKTADVRMELLSLMLLSPLLLLLCVRCFNLSQQ